MMTAAFFEAVVCVICGLFFVFKYVSFFGGRVPVGCVDACVRVCVLIVNLRKDVFERRTSTGSGLFSLFFGQWFCPSFRKTRLYNS